MRNRIWLLGLLWICATGTNGQFLYDDQTVSKVYITLPEDTLKVILTDVYSDVYRRADFVFEYKGRFDTLRDVGFRLRGNTSRTAKKKSYRISFNEFKSGRSYDGVKKLNLNGQHNDPTLVREKLFYNIWNKMGMPVRRLSFVNLYINGRNYGLYTNAEEMDKDWLSRTFTNSKGNLYKCTYPADLVYLGSNPADYKSVMSGNDRAYDLKTNTGADDYSDLIALTALLHNPGMPGWQDSMEHKVNLPILFKAYALEIMAGHWDNYAFNKNNYYLYHHPGDNRFWYISYDADNTFGVDWVNRDWATRDVHNWFSQSEPRPLISRIRQIPQWNRAFAQIFDTVLSAYKDTTVLFRHIDSLRDLIAPFVIADTFRTLDYGYTLSDFYAGYNQKVDVHTPYGIKPFIAKRWESASGQNRNALFLDPVQPGAMHKVFPNPLNRGGQLNLQTPGEELVQAELTDMMGRSVVFRASEWLQTDFTRFSPGIYRLRIITNVQTTHHKIILNN